MVLINFQIQCGNEQTPSEPKASNDEIEYTFKGKALKPSTKLQECIKKVLVQHDTDIEKKKQEERIDIFWKCLIIN